jgi:hypothetical protein
MATLSLASASLISLTTTVGLRGCVEVIDCPDLPLVVVA